MTNDQEIVEKLSQFSNLNFTKKQWDVILKGCGCPKSAHFWTALRNNNLIKHQRTYTLTDMDAHSYAVILEEYNTVNRAAAAKSYKKAKAKKQIEEWRKSYKGHTFFMTGGVITTENPKEI